MNRKIKFISVWITTFFLLVLRSGSENLYGDELSWESIDAFSMNGGLKVYWNIIDHSNGRLASAAYSKGFQPVTLLGTYSDFPGKQQKNINIANKGNVTNPWQRPSFFEGIIRRNIQMTQPVGIYVHDIEIPFSEDIQAAWNDRQARKASGVDLKDDFLSVYFEKWAEWFFLPLKWTKEIYPNSVVGLYGTQPFHRDYYLNLNRSARKIDEEHNSDKLLWRYIDPYVDFYTSSVYFSLNKPDSIYYLAVNVEENFRRTRSTGSTKPLYAYEWLRYMSSAPELQGREISPYLAEAMAIVPYFSGAKGIVLWGYEPQVTEGDTQPYEQLPLFVQSLRRVSMISDKIGRGKLLDDRPASQLWKDRSPLIRRILIGQSECVVMAVDPWQKDNEQSTHPVECGRFRANIVMFGQHTTLVLLDDHGEVIY